MTEQLQRYLRAFRELNVNRNRGSASPHKPCMLLAVLGLAEAGDLERNEIRFNPAILERYAKFFDVVRGTNDHANPYFPFFHLRSEGFWHLRALPGREAVVEAMGTARSVSAIVENIEYVQLDPELHELVIQEGSRAALREELIVRWLGTSRSRLEAVLQEERGSDHYEKLLREGTAATVGAVAERPLESVRSAAFRRIVGERYDYRCAASGWRIILPDSRFMIEAAHLIPFSVSYDDDPRNGIALAPSYHWALDAHVISPGPDFKWHVSDSLDRRIPDNKPLLELAGTELLLPKDKSCWPRLDALEWRFEHLLSLDSQ